MAHDSAAIVANLAHQVTSNYAGHVAFNDHRYNTTLYTVAAGQAVTNVAFDDCQHKGVTPSQLTGPTGWFQAIPIPQGAVPAAGTDSEMTIWQPSSDTLWELWVAHRSTDGWHACWGGRLDHALESPGYFPGGGGATATGLPVAGGMVTIADVRRGSIDHVMNIEVIEARRSPAHSWPAQRSDGQSLDPTTPLEGQRFRLDPSVDVSKLKLTPLGAMVAKAAQEYGFVVMDRSGSVALQGESGLSQQGPSGRDPWVQLLGSATPQYALLDGFPWSRLQALPIDYGRPS